MNLNNQKSLEKDGFVLIKNYFTQEEADMVVSWANELESWPEEKGKWMIYHENNEGAKKRARLENFLKYQPKLNDILFNRLKPLLEELVSDKVNLFKEKINWKYPGGKGFKPHQDHPAWTDFQGDKFFTMAMFANNTTKENGCLEFVKGKNKDGVLSYDKNGTGQISKEVEDTLDWRHITTTTRDLLIFDSYAPHRSDKNITDESRRIFYFTFNYNKDGDHYKSYLVRKRKEFPPDIERNENTQISGLGNKYNLANPID